MRASLSPPCLRTTLSHGPATRSPGREVAPMRSAHSMAFSSFDRSVLAQRPGECGGFRRRGLPRPASALDDRPATRRARSTPPVSANRPWSCPTPGQGRCRSMRERAGCASRPWPPTAHWGGPSVLRADLGGGLADDLDEADEREREHPAGVEFRPTPSLHERHRLASRVEDVADPHAVILQTAPPRCERLPRVNSGSARPPSGDPPSGPGCGTTPVPAPPS